MRIPLTVLIILLFNIGSPLLAQDSLPTIDLKVLEVRALRIATPPLKHPFSISTYQASTLQQTRQQLSLQEYLTQIPGLFSLNANNYAQDLRLSIRGFGARSAFGIRGIKIIVDGIPETTPDGQGQIDNLNLGNIQRIEVLKGPSSTLYGNASGGSIHIYTQEKIATNFLEAGLTIGSFNMQQYQLAGGFGKKNTQLIFQGTHTRSDGYRDQSAVENTNVNLRLFQKISKKAKFNAQVNYTNSPIGDDPGGLNLDEVLYNPRQARDRNILYKTGEAIDQFKLGGQYQYQVTKQQSLQLYGFYNHRNFEGRLPFTNGGWVDLQRDYWGQGGHYKWEKTGAISHNILQIGYDLAWQADHRQRYRNLEGFRGAGTLDQVERFSMLGVYLLDHWYWNKWLMTVGVRFDGNRLEVEDQKLDDGDQSGSRNLPAVNPSIGINYQLTERVALYGSFRSSFETPSLSELSANPSGEAGFNPGLESQRAFNYELGGKGLIFNRVDFDLALFYIQTQNDLVPFELAEFPDRSFFRNAGSTKRQGLEVWARYQITSQFSFKTSYTFSDFQYQDYQLPQGDFSGKALPGIPKHFAAFTLAYQNDQGINIRLQHRYISDFFANDANSSSEPAYQITDFSLGYRLQTKTTIWTPFFGINNIFDTAYSDNIRLNAFGKRFYEPAPRINAYCGLRFRLAAKN